MRTVIGLRNEDGQIERERGQGERGGQREGDAEPKTLTPKTY